MPGAGTPGAHGVGAPVRWIVAGGLTLIGLAHLGLFAPLPPLWREVAAMLILLTPGALAALAVAGAAADSGERALLGLAGGVAVAALLMLALHALPGPLAWWAPMLAADLLALAGAYALWHRRTALSMPPPALRPTRWLLLPLLLAVSLRLVGLGNAEHQGDEAYALMLAMGVAHGREEILLVHMKGPVEALLPAGILTMTGTLSETGARLPFALAGVGLVLGVWALAGRLIGGQRGDLVGLIAAVAVAADGLLVAFGRIVQYQTVVMLLAAAALLLAWRFAGLGSLFSGGTQPGLPNVRPAAPDQGGMLLAAAALCAAVAVLAHYDGAYVAPALAWLSLAGGIRRGWRRPLDWLRGLGPAVGLGLVLSLSFYVPFVRHEHFARTLGHLATRSGQGALPTLFNNLPDYAVLLSVYNTRYLVFAAGLSLLASLVWLLLVGFGVLHWPVPPFASTPRQAHRAGQARLGVALALLLGLGGLLTVTALPAGSHGGNLASLLLVPPLLGLALAPRLAPGLRLLVLWLVPALLAHALLLADPRTHFYTMHTPGWLLIALGLVILLEQWPRLRPLVAGGTIGLLSLSLAYTGLVMLRPWPEYERAYPATLLPFFTPLSGTSLPDDGIFGFPQRDGWKAAALLFAQGQLRGTFDTNQELFTPGWYLRGQFKCIGDPDYFLTATNARPLFIPPDYHYAGSVTVEEIEALEIYSRLPVPDPPQQFAVEDIAATYAAMPVPNFPLRRLLSGVVPQHTVDVAWRDGFSLRGFDLDRITLGPSDPAFVTLYWRAEQPLSATSMPVVLVQDAQGREVAELEPFCSGMPAATWYANYANETPFRLLPGMLPPGDYTLLVGVRVAPGGAWLPLRDGSSLTRLATIQVHSQ